jgi:tRNA(Ile)-lysidine synthase
MFEDSVLKTIQKYNMIDDEDSIVVAVSGGPDSMSLLNVLIKLKSKFKLNLFVAHVNHMIRAVADEETEYVKNFCKKNNIECFVKKVDVIAISKEQKISTEEAGRNIRYDFFEEVCNKVHANKIAIAHNKNDNAETVFMNIMRGSGTSGLKGIEPIRQKYIRPLIEMSRPEIEKYCELEHLNPKFDESNKENIYTRNKIRNLLIPFIEKEFNPNIISSINRLSDIASQENLFIERYVENAYQSICLEESAEHIKLDLKKFNSLDVFIRNKIILFCVNKLFNSTKGIEKIHIDDVVKLCERNIGNKFLTPNKNLKVFVKKGEVGIYKI